MIDRNKRNLLRGRIRPTTIKPGSDNTIPNYPPWALPSDKFMNTCTRCTDCIKHCPEHILIPGDGGFPEIDFRLGECTFCEECVSSCQFGALIKQHSNQKPWTSIAHIKDSCLAHKGVTCSRCADECESRSIKLNYSVLGISTPTVNSESCTGCVACVSVCPVNAIESYATESYANENNV